MPQGLQAVLALAVLLPGFVSARIVRTMSQKTVQSELERVIEALIFSFFTYLIYVPFYVAVWGGELPFAWKPTADASKYYYSGHYYDVAVHGWRLLWVPAIAIVLGTGWGYVREQDMLLKGMRRVRWTSRSGYESVWADVLQYVGGNVQVGLGDGRSLLGLLRQYSQADGERTLLLQDASWIAEDGSTVRVPGDGLVLLTEKAEIKYVLFLDEGQKVKLPR